MARNPFTPTFGVSPPLLVGRSDLLEDFVAALEDGPGAPGRMTLDTGARGTGKTVMLNEVEDLARQQVVPELREVATVLQHLVREEREIALVGAGLPSAVSAVRGRRRGRDRRRSSPSRIVGPRAGSR